MQKLAPASPQSWDNPSLEKPIYFSKTTEATKLCKAAQTSKFTEFNKAIPSLSPE
jgi:hypothetical protein